MALISGTLFSSAHAGLRAARLAVFGGIPWQRYQFHLQQNAQAYLPCKEMQTKVSEDIRTIFNAPTRPSQKTILLEGWRSIKRLLPVWQLRQFEITEAGNSPEDAGCSSQPTGYGRLHRLHHRQLAR
jgi:Transposase, Mutator family